VFPPPSNSLSNGDRGKGFLFSPSCLKGIAGIPSAAVSSSVLGEVIPC
jgi:hypothetical protein